MPRRKRGRKMLIPPLVKGMSVESGRGKKFDDVCLFHEEFETIRLLDYRGLTQEEAAVFMEVSRPTLTRIYEDARRKVAKAFVEGRDLSFNKGEYFFDDHWHICTDCKTRFTMFDKKNATCPMCGSANIKNLNESKKK